VGLASSVSAGSVAALSGCSSDEATAEPTPTAEAGPVTKPDGSTTIPDAGQPPIEAGGDTGQVDAYVNPVTTVLGATGKLNVYPFGVIASFHEDDTIIHSSEAPDCVAHVRSVTKPGSPAGNLTVGGDAVGKAGGPPAPVVIPPDSTADNSYVAFLDDPLLFFPQPGQGEHVQLSLEGTGSVPAMPVTSLTATVLDHVTVTVPMVPDSGTVSIDSTKAFALKWDVADAGAAAPRVVAQFQNMFNAKKVVDIVCSWPLSAGQATIPASFLAAVKAQAGEIEGGQIVLYLGDAKEATSAAHSYTIVLARDPSAELGAPGITGFYVDLK
jgi:hypothetical protein